MYCSGTLHYVPQFGLWVWEGRPQRWSPLFSMSYHGYIHHHGFTAEADLEHPTEGVFLSFSSTKITVTVPHPLPYWIPLEGSHSVQPTLKRWGVTLHFLEGGLPIQIIWNSSAWGIDLFPHLFICLFNYLYQYGLTDINFILCAIFL